MDSVYWIQQSERNDSYRRNTIAIFQNRTPRVLGYKEKKGDAIIREDSLSTSTTRIARTNSLGERSPGNRPVSLVVPVYHHHHHASHRPHSIRKWLMQAQTYYRVLTNWMWHLNVNSYFPKFVFVHICLVNMSVETWQINTPFSKFLDWPMTVAASGKVSKH